MSAAIAVERLTKRYGEHAAVDGIDFEVARGDVVGFLGPNGAGKSTTLKILAGFLGATSGRAFIDGHDVVDEPHGARRATGYMPEAVPLYGEMRVAEYLAFRAELKRVPRARRRASVDAAMEKASVTDRANVLIGSLSKGYKQRVGLADALVARPPLLILDEPTAGLDPNQIREVRDVIRALGAEHTVLLSTHILSEVEASCSKVVVINKGRLVAQGPTRDIQRMRRASALDVVARGDADVVTKILQATPGVSKVARAPDEETRDGAGDAGAVATYRCTWARKLAEADVAGATESLVARLVEAGAHVREVRPVGSSLEEVFSELTRGQGIEGGADAKPDARTDGGAAA